MQRSIIFNQMSFSWSTRPLFHQVNLAINPGWTGLVGANGTGKTTLLRLILGELEPSEGHISGGGGIYCEQRTDHPPAKLIDLLEAADSYRIMAQLAIGYDWPERWSTLSHGERKRAQVAVALWQQPHILALDEPTNHLDQATRNMLLVALSKYRGTGLLVSHNRQLLDQLCQSCLFMNEQGRVVLRPGNFTKANQQALKEQNHQANLYLSTRKERLRLTSEYKRRRQQVGHKNRLSKRGINPKDHDAKGRIDAARLTGKDGSAARRSKVMRERVDRLESVEAMTRPDKDRGLGIRIPGACSRRNFLCTLPAGTLAMGERQLRYPKIAIGPQDRIAITGANGAGKSTLIQHITQHLSLEPHKVTFLAQEISRAETASLQQQAMKLPAPVLGKILTVVSHLGSNPKSLLASELASPGEARKLKLAMGLAKDPHLIVMDEPTNHLDLPSIQCLEQALSQFPGALILVSHDAGFLKATCNIQWHIEHDLAQVLVSLTM